MEKKKIIIIGIIALICISAVSIYAYDKNDENNNSGPELYFGYLIRTSINKTEDSATFKVVLDQNQSTIDGEYSPLGKNNSHLKLDIHKPHNKPSDEMNDDEFIKNETWEYIDHDESNTVTTGDKVIIYNRSRYIGIKTALAMEICKGTLNRKSKSVETKFLEDGI